MGEPEEIALAPKDSPLPMFPSDSLRRSPRKNKANVFENPFDFYNRQVRSDQPFLSSDFPDPEGSPSSRTRRTLGMDQYAGSDPVRLNSPSKLYGNAIRASYNMTQELGNESFATFPSSPVDSRAEWNGIQGSTPDWRTFSFPELPDEEDPEYNPEQEDDEEEEPGSGDEEDGDDTTIQGDIDLEFDLQQLLRDAQQEIVLPRPLTELLQEDEDDDDDDDDDTEYEPDEEEEEEDPHGDSDDDEVVFDPSEFDLEELLKDAQEEYPILPKPLTELLEDMGSDDDEYRPDHDDDDEDDDDFDENAEYDPLDFDIDALLRDAQREPLANPYTPQAQEFMAQEMLRAAAKSAESSPVAYTTQPSITVLRPSLKIGTPASTENMSVKELLSLRRDQMEEERKRRGEHQLKSELRRSYVSQTQDQAPNHFQLLSHDHSSVSSNIPAVPSQPHRSSAGMLPLHGTELPQRTVSSSTAYQGMKLDAHVSNKAPHNAGTTTQDTGVVERCPHCQRIFRGPKSATHKQQHIKRLHPENYVRKKGGVRPRPVAMRFD